MGHDWGIILHAALTFNGKSEKKARSICVLVNAIFYLIVLFWYASVAYQASVVDGTILLCVLIIILARGGREEIWDQYQYLGDCAPTPPLTQHAI